MESGLREPRTKRSRLFSAMSGSAKPRQMPFQLVADDGQQVEGHAGRGHAQQVAVPPPHVGDAQSAEPHGRGIGVVEILAEG